MSRDVNFTNNENPDERLLRLIKRKADREDWIVDNLIISSQSGKGSSGVSKGLTIDDVSTSVEDVILINLPDGTITDDGDHEATIDLVISIAVEGEVPVPFSGAVVLDASAGSVIIIQTDGLFEFSTSASVIPIADSADNFVAAFIETALSELFTGPKNFLVTPSSDPVNDYEVANKQYVDNAIGYHFDNFFNDTLSSIGGIYYDMTDNDLGGVESTLTKAAMGGGDDQALFNFASLAGEPGINQLELGILDTHLHVEKTVGNRSLNIYVELYKYELDTTETLLATSELSRTITTKTAVNLHFVLGADVTFAQTDRLVVKVLANLGAGGPTTVVLYQEGDTDSHLTFTTTSAILSNIFVRLDTPDYVTLTDGSNADALHEHAGIVKYHGLETIPIGDTVVDLGAIADDDFKHDVWVKVKTLDGISHAQNRPRAPELGGIDFLWYKDAGNLKVRISNDSGTDKTVVITYT